MGLVSKTAQLPVKLLRFFGVDLYGLILKLRIKFLLGIHKCNLRTDGLVIFTYLPLPGSILQVARDFIDKLALTSVPFTVIDMTINISKTTTLPQEEIKKYQQFISRKIDQKVCLSFIERKHNPSSLQVINPVWCEVSDGLEKINPDIANGHFNLVTFTTFCHEAFSKIIKPESINYYVRYPVRLNLNITSDKNTLRKDFSIPADAFVVFFNFSLGANFERKNPIGALKAFSEFVKKCHNHLPKPIFVLKLIETVKGQDNFSRIKAEVNALKIETNVIYISKLLSREEILNLTKCADVYLSLHRSEGLGLGIIESMSVNVPVIATNYGGCTDFINEENAFLVPYTLTPVDKSYSAYAAEWAEPDIQMAAKYLYEIYNNPNLGKIKSNSAKKFIDEYYSAKSFEGDIRSMLSQINAHSGIK